MINLRLENRDWKVFSSTSIISLLYILPIILAGRYYIDDLGRSMEGYSSWGIDGRPLSDLVMYILNIGYPLADLSPLTQCLAVISLSYCLTLYARVYFNNVNWLTASLVSFLFIGSPFFIENISYKFDSVTMALSAASLILIFAMRSSGAISWIASCFLILASLSLYQATIGLFVILSCIEAIHLIRNNEKELAGIFIQLFARAFSLLASFLVYKFIIVKIFAQGSYQSLRSGSVPLDSTFLLKIEDNLNHFLNWLILPLIHSVPVIAIIIYSILMASFLLLVFKRSDKRPAIKSVLVLAFIFISVPFFFIHVVALNNPAFVPRVLISFCGCMLMIGYIIVNSGVSNRLAVIFLAPVVYFSFFYVNAYSSASSAQNRSDELVASSLYYDISHSNASFETTAVIGSLPESRQRIITAWKLPLVSGLIPIYMADGWWGNEFMKHYRVNLNITPTSDEDRNSICKNQPLIKSKDYNLFLVNKRLIIEFNKYDCK